MPLKKATQRCAALRIEKNTSLSAFKGQKSGNFVGNYID